MSATSASSSSSSSSSMTSSTKIGSYFLSSLSDLSSLISLSSLGLLIIVGGLTPSSLLLSSLSESSNSMTWFVWGNRSTGTGACYIFALSLAAAALSAWEGKGTTLGYWHIRSVSNSTPGISAIRSGWTNVGSGYFSMIYFLSSILPLPQSNFLPIQLRNSIFLFFICFIESLSHKFATLTMMSGMGSLSKVRLTKNLPVFK